MPFLSSSRDCQFQQEIPVTTPIFEGHLFVRNDKRHWQWRLFRFDGSFFTCLSAHKLKTTASASAAITTLTTSPVPLKKESSMPLLLATPKDKSKRLTDSATSATTTMELKYYQLPEWTVDLTQVSSINVLKKVKKSNYVVTRPSRCFSIRTFQGACHVLKAQKQKDLERWLFVLSRMWKFMQAVKEQQERLLQYDVNDNIPLVHSINNNNNNNKAVMAVNTSSHSASFFPNLSEEKVQVIEKWRTSLAELMANDPLIRISTPPPIESLPDDDNISVFTDMTSISNRPKMIKRRTTNASNKQRSRSIRRNNTTTNKTNSIVPASSGQYNKEQQQQQQQQQLQQENNNKTKEKTLPLEKGDKRGEGPTLRKKRSDDVRNWMNTSRSLRKPMIQKLNTYGFTSSSHVSTSPEIYHVNYFQDETTSICHDENCACNNKLNIQKQQPEKLRYHTSLRGKHVQLIQNEDRIQEYYNQANNKKEQVPVFEDAQLNSLSPLQFLTIKKEEEEEMSLADLQKSLRKVQQQQEDWKQPASAYSIDTPIVAQTSSNFFFYKDAAFYKKQRHSSYFL